MAKFLRVLFPLVLVMLGGCKSLNIFGPLPGQMSVVHGCVGASVDVYDARGVVLAVGLKPGVPQAIPLPGRAGDSIELIASAFSITTGNALGTARRSVDLPTERIRDDSGSYEVRDYKEQVRSWEITSLSTRADPNYSCRRGYD